MSHNSDHLKPIIIVVGGQYGSESKGLVAADLAVEKKVDYCVRTGAINAGHTVYYRDKAYVNQQIPVGWVNPDSKLVIGAGAYVDPVILAKEVAMINEAMPEANVLDRLFIDQRAGSHLEKHYKQEEDAHIHEKMGSTGHGCGAAMMDKLGRSHDYKLFRDIEEAKGYTIADTVSMLNEAYDNQRQILLEGTQGTLLDFHLSYYPFCTTRQTIAANWLAEAGLSPHLLTEIHLVIRTMPIRVAGNSGPMGEKETRWPDLATMVNKKLLAAGKFPIVDQDLVDKFDQFEKQYINENLPAQGDDQVIEADYTKWTTEQRWANADFLSKLHVNVLKLFTAAEVTELKKFFEITTVTKKLRRIAYIDNKELAYSIMINRPTYLDINFLNYLFPSCYGAETVEELQNCAEWPLIDNFLQNITIKFKVAICRVNCSPRKTIIIPAIGGEYIE
jgi:adenylosuccinate synthase